MSDGLYVAMSGAIAQERALDVTANNVANGNSTGFRAQRVTFAEVLGGQGNLSFVSAEEAAVDTSKGEIRTTGNPLDVAVDGDGWFAMETPEGPRYTRSGAFRIGPGGTLMDERGNGVLDVGNKPLLIPPGAKEVTVDPAGQLIADGVPLGQIQIVSLNDGKLRNEGGNLYSAPGGVKAVENAAVVSGHLEQANFDPVRGMVDLIRISRNHESLH
ncbi:MAG: flagellar basal-body rod protein FlgF, partial [Nannocystaceae bacterium]|nr:flagellar basal-body rod protein FlgF [Nannocystaceae bacterium]